MYSCEIGIFVDTRTHLKDIINRLQKLKEVTSVKQVN